MLISFLSSPFKVLFSNVILRRFYLFFHFLTLSLYLLSLRYIFLYNGYLSFPIFFYKIFGYLSMLFLFSFSFSSLILSNSVLVIFSYLHSSVSVDFLLFFMMIYMYYDYRLSLLLSTPSLLIFFS